MRTRWISPQFVSTNRVDSVGDYQQVREMGARVIEALGIGTSATHMEWFFGPKGLKFSEIGCRPPGVGAWDLYSAGNDLDIYREWANAIVHGTCRRQPVPAVLHRHRGAASGTRRPHLRLLRHRRDPGPPRRVGHRRALPDPGTPTQPHEAGYLANAYVRMRHPDYDVLRGMLDEVGRTITVHSA